MKKFKGMKPFDTIIEEAKNTGWEVDTTEWDNGGDWFWLRDMHNRVLQVCVNCFGKFMVYAPFSDKPIDTHESTEFDDKDWYNELLDLLYESLEVKEQV